ncbi:MAG: hypothetical protein ABL986_22160 [Vicinamibacterales bacterium]
MNRLMVSACGAMVLAVMSAAPSAQQPAPRGSAVGALPRVTQAPVAAATGTKSVGTVRDIMLSMVMPSSDVVFGAGAEEPKSEVDWEKLRINAIELAESANLLMIGSRVRDRADWLKMARAQLDTAEAVARLAAARKVEGLSDASDKVYETCPACHNKYWADRNAPR